MTTAKRKPQKSAHGRAQKTNRPVRKVAPATPRYSEQYERALKEYERATGLIQKRNFAEAKQIFETLIEKFPEEQEICDRSRHYLAICNDRLHPKTAKPVDVADYFHLGVYHLNRADSDSAIKEFQKALEKDARSEMIHYGIASAYAMGGDKSRAITSLREAIRLNEKNRIYAQNDPDFDSVRDEHEFIQLVEPEEIGAP
jgi:tetratricopeptide (TPR) repeat protein